MVDEWVCSKRTLVPLLQGSLRDRVGHVGDLDDVVSYQWFDKAKKKKEPETYVSYRSTFLSAPLSISDKNKCFSAIKR